MTAPVFPPVAFVRTESASPTPASDFAGFTETTLRSRWKMPSRAAHWPPWPSRIAAPSKPLTLRYWNSMPFSALIVDDEPLAREGLRLLLAEDAEFADVHEAANGREAVEQIRSARPDLVFLDVQMPEMDGFGVVREIG